MSGGLKLCANSKLLWEDEDDKYYQSVYWKSFTKFVIRTNSHLGGLAVPELVNREETGTWSLGFFRARSRERKPAAAG
jgi:hypothetical protein